MSKERSGGKPMTRRNSPEEKASVRMVRTLLGHVVGVATVAAGAGAGPGDFEFLSGEGKDEFDGLPLGEVQLPKLGTFVERYPCSWFRRPSREGPQ